MKDDKKTALPSSSVPDIQGSSERSGGLPPSAITQNRPVIIT